ncbi:MAG: hypothetical protein K2Y37_19390 [Pirellulales bacterium]|nr:hypothetical protein [Pirellulales bacterium]
MSEALTRARCVVLPAVFLAAMAGAALPVAAQGYRPGASRPDLFYNYYVGPSPTYGGVPAQMYLSPRPVPPHVGHTWITYQPLMPHEFLYTHHRTYYRHFGTSDDELGPLETGHGGCGTCCGTCCTKPCCCKHCPGTTITRVRWGHCCLDELPAFPGWNCRKW